MKILFKNYYLIALCWLLGCLVIISRRPDMILNPQPWAEDGTIFISQAIYHGYKSIFMQYAGYLHLIPRIVTIFAIHISILFNKGIILVPLIMNIFAISLSSASIVFILSRRFSWLGPTRVRIVMFLAIILIPGAFEIYGTITNVQWWIGVFLFLVSWDMIIKQSFPRGFLLLFVIPASLTGPLGVLIILSCIVVIIQRLNARHHISMKDIIYISAMSFGGFVQVLLALSNRVNATNLDFATSTDSFIKVLFSGVFSRLVLPKFQESVNKYHFLTITFIGIVICLLIYYLNISKKQLFIIPFLLCIILFAMTLKGNGEFFLTFSEYFRGGGERYIFIPCAAILISLLASFQHDKSNKLQVSISFLLCLLFLITASYNFHFAPYADKNYTKSVQTFDLRGENQCTAKINPDWNFPFPCR